MTRSAFDVFDAVVSVALALAAPVAVYLLAVNGHPAFAVMIALGWVFYLPVAYHDVRGERTPAPHLAALSSMVLFGIPLSLLAFSTGDHALGLLMAVTTTLCAGALGKRLSRARWQ